MPGTLLEGEEKKYLNTCLKQRRNFTSFVASVDADIGVESEVTLKGISSRLATKWKKPYSRTCGCMNSRVEVTLVRAAQHCIKGTRVTAYKIRVKCPQLEEGAGLHLFR